MSKQKTYGSGGGGDTVYIQDVAYGEAMDEIERLRSSNTDLQRECLKRGERIAELERLIIRASDALQTYGGPQGEDNLVDLHALQLSQELRKAAE